MVDSVHLGRGLANLWISRSLPQWVYKKILSAFPVYSLYFNEPIHDKLCEDKSVRQTENV